MDCTNQVLKSDSYLLRFITDLLIHRFLHGTYS
jgi:hypothetical protein